MSELLELDEATHTWKLNGRVVAGVTEVLRDVGVVDTTWFTDDASIRGSDVALTCQLFLEDDLDEGSLPPVFTGYLNGFKRFLTETGFKPRFIEHKVHGINWAGRLDWAGEMGGANVLIDGKSGAVPTWCRLQTAAYADGLAYCETWQVEKRFGLQLKPDAKYSLSKPYTEASDHDYWRACLAIYYGKRNGWEPMPTHAPVNKDPPLFALPPEIAVEPDAGDRLLVVQYALKLVNERLRNRTDERLKRLDLLQSHFGIRSSEPAELAKLPLSNLKEGIITLKQALGEPSEAAK